MIKAEAGRSIVVLGPSGSGKSSLVNAARDPRFADRLTIPRRVITLPVREDSDQVENENVDPETFQERLRDGTVRPWWTRQLGGKAVHFYGFEAPDPDDDRTALYLANNSMALSANGNGVRDLLAGSDIVLVLADRDERERRLAMRAPSMAPEERAARLDDELDFLFVGGHGQVQIVDTSAENLETSSQRFLEFVIGETAARSMDAAPGELPKAA